MTKPIAIVDLFSGPGGLGEGFSAARDKMGGRRYEINISVEKEASAHKTLRLRAFLRRFSEFPAEYYAWLAEKITEPHWHKLYPLEWEAAEDEALWALLHPSRSVTVPQLDRARGCPAADLS